MGTSGSLSMNLCPWDLWKITFMVTFCCTSEFPYLTLFHLFIASRTPSNHSEFYYIWILLVARLRWISDSAMRGDLLLAETMRWMFGWLNRILEEIHILWLVKAHKWGNTMLPITSSWDAFVNNSFLLCWLNQCYWYKRPSKR